MDISSLRRCNLGRTPKSRMNRDRKPDKVVTRCSRFQIFRSIFFFSTFILASSLPLSFYFFEEKLSSTIETPSDLALFIPTNPPGSESKLHAQTTHSLYRQPRFILHIGPHKTATTSIQCALYQYRKDLQELDSILYLGKVDEKFCQVRADGGKTGQDERVRKMESCFKDEKCWQGLEGEWGSHRANGVDLVLSKEGISDWASANHSKVEWRQQFWPKFIQALDGWNVTVVLTYRPYFEWLPSAFNQHSHHMRLQARQPFPKSHEPMGTFGETLVRILDENLLAPYPFVDEILTFSFPSSWNIRVVNLHETGDVVKAFLCETLVAEGTCTKYQAVPPSRKSPAEDLAYDYLNIQALRWGWIQETHKRGALMRSTRNFVKHTLRSNVLDYPFDCPTNQTMKKLLERSITLEKNIIGFADSHDLSTKFWASTGRLCTINAKKALLANKTLWMNFYLSL